MHLLKLTVTFPHQSCLFFASNIVFSHFQVANMEIGAVPLWVRSPTTTTTTTTTN